MMTLKAKAEELFTGALGYAMLPLFALPSITWLYALWHDIKHDNFVFFAADAIFFPMGILHGVILYFWP